MGKEKADTDSHQPTKSPAPYSVTIHGRIRDAIRVIVQACLLTTAHRRDEVTKLTSRPDVGTARRPHPYLLSRIEYVCTYTYMWMHRCIRQERLGVLVQISECPAKVPEAVRKPTISTRLTVTLGPNACAVLLLLYSVAPAVDSDGPYAARWSCMYLYMRTIFQPTGPAAIKGPEWKESMYSRPFLPPPKFSGRGGTVTVAKGSPVRLRARLPFPFLPPGPVSLPPSPPKSQKPA